MPVHAPSPEEEDDPTTEVTAADAASLALVGGKYRVIKTIAKGGMGQVLLAEHVDLKRQVALKVMDPPKHGNAHSVDFEERFRTEARVLANLEHPNIVTVHDFGVLPDGRGYLAMSFVEGPRLADVLKRGPLPVDEALRLAMQVCSALRYAHQRGVVHRDVSPSNLLLATEDDGTTTIRMVDFGIAKVDRMDSEETQDGVILGSPHSMAPEQVDGVGVDVRTDVYAVGVLLFRMLTGSYPYRGSNAMAIMMAHLEAPIPSIRTRHPDGDLDQGLDAIVQRCLAKEADDRFEDVDALIDALTPYVELPTGTWSQSMPTLAPATDERTGLRTLLLASLLAVVGLGSLGGAMGVLVWSRANPTADLPDEPVPEAQATPASAVVPVTAPRAEVAPATPDEASPPAPAPKAAEPAPARPATRRAPTTSSGRTEPTPEAAPASERSAPAPETTSAPRKQAPSGYQGLPDDF